MIVKLLATCCDSGSVGFGLLGADVGGVAWVGHLFVLRYLSAGDPVKDVHTFSGAITLEQSDKFVFA